MAQRQYWRLRMNKTDKYDDQVEQDIVKWASTTRWVTTVKNKIKDERKYRYVIGGILVKNLETLPIHVVRKKRVQIQKEMDVSPTTLCNYMNVYTTCRLFNKGCSFAEQYDYSTIALIRRFADGDKDRFIEAVNYLKTHTTVSFRALVTRNDALDKTITFMRFAVTADERENVLAALSLQGGTHQGQQLLQLVEEYMSLKYAKVA